MAEAALFTIAGGIISKLSSPAFREASHWWNVQDEAEKLKMTVSTIQAVLLDAEQKYSQSNQVKNWVNLLEEALYDADDLLDEFFTKTLQKQVMTGNRFSKEVHLFFSSSNQLKYGLRMAHKIKKIRSKLDVIAACKNFQLDERHEENFVMDEVRESHSSLPEVVVGREGDKKKIIEYLLSSSDRQNVSVLTVTGLGGLGKSTLAQLVCNDESVKSHFDLKLWAHIGNNFDVKLIVGKILESVVGERSGILELNTLKNLLLEKINGKRFLLVLDDVWNEREEKWFQLKDLLVGGAKGSVIIVTTRLAHVAEMIRSDLAYELQGLADFESWSLFKQMAFNDGQVPSPKHETVGKEIMEKCVGVPLAIRAMGTLLYSKSLSEWSSIRDQEVSNINENILPILKLSYNHLPSHLKHCFAYCRLFPKGTTISVPFLVRLWIALGYIKQLDSKQCLEDIGYEYFKNLLWRSFFQDVEEDQLGNIKSCKMHDLIHDLAVLISGKESCLLNSKEELVEAIDGGTRHMCIDFEIDTYLQVSNSLSGAEKVRSFIVSSSRKETKEGELHVIFSKLKRARVLLLREMGIDQVPHSIGKMTHLRYLDLSDNKSIEMLPDSITKLRNLQVLKLACCERLKQLPKDIKKLISLRDLTIVGCVSLTHMPQGLGQLTCLQCLSTFIVAEDNGDSKDSGGLGELQSLKNLRYGFFIANLRYVKNPASEFEAANLKEKQHLQRLILAWKMDNVFDDDDDDDDDGMSLEELRPHLNLKQLYVYGSGRLAFPFWVSSLTNLVNLRIYNCKKCKHFPPLDQFPNLKEMSIEKLVDLECIEIGIQCYNAVEVPSFFPSLDRLWLKNCPNLKGWQRETSTLEPELFRFHCLDYLQINFCPNLTSMPLIPSVQKLVLKNGSVKSLEDILKRKISVPQSVSSSSSISPACSKLKGLGIHNIEDMESLPEELMQNLTSLQQLDIFDCPRLTTLSHALPHLTSLQLLIIKACDKLDLWDDENVSGMKWQCLINLQDFQIHNNSKLVSLPKWLVLVPTLRRLLIKSCPNLMSMPEWMSNFSALSHIYIEECPQLSERCRNNMGADWKKIAHISNIRIDGRWIK